jgi:cellulose synthase/poly-beta-1,6-N-acetylglucosamine synthase-like glycosyltransferase/spore germination protein YaaH/peptidoglycan/xylan/chitin deacetylase (PgdA/CDA1 family)
MKERSPIFYDAERVRWRRTRRVLEISGALLTMLLVYFFFNIAASIELPAALLPDSHSLYYRALKVNKRPAKPALPTREGRHRRVANLGKPVPANYDPLRAAFYVSYDANSLATLRKHYKDLDLVIPEELHAVTPDGGLTIVDYERYRTVKATPLEAIAILHDDRFHQWMRVANIEIPVMGMLNNYDGRTWRVAEMAQMLGDPSARANLVRDTVEYAVESHEVGIVVDFEEVPQKTEPYLEEFIAELAPALHAVGLKIMISLPAQDDTFDYAYYGKQCDAVVIMNYDQHWPAAEPGPIAAQDWFMDNLHELLKEIPAQKMIVGIANYGYDWPEPNQKSHPVAKDLSVQEALLHAYESEAQVELDPASLNPHYSYSDDSDRVHQVWFLDAVTAYNQMRGAERLGVQGTALWRLGSSDTSLWKIWDATRPDDSAREKLKDVPPGPDLILEGNGDIWRIADKPKRGVRSFTYDKASDLFTAESYDSYPLSYEIDQLGAVPKKLALSFDDGPDPHWTPKILDILKEKQVPASFFVIGEEAAKSPRLLQREYTEGHSIGNHTYTHPVFDEISPTQLRWELNITQRLIESTLGVKSILFRPPYGIDHQPEYAEEVAQLPIAQDMGYLIVGQKIDPHDWRQPYGKQVAAQEIIDGVIQQADAGNIILFHDGGGDRSQTVAALPVIIDELRAHGFQFVPVPELINKTRAEVMVPLTGTEWLQAKADGFIFGLYHWFTLGIGWVFILGIVLVSGRALIIGILALVEKVRPDHDQRPARLPGVTVLIPAHNEEGVIVQTVRSVLASDYPAMRVVVVNDGSADSTGMLLDAHFGGEPRVQIIHQVNRGKAAALNNALARAQTEIVVTIDADTEIEPDAIRQLLRHFSDPRTGAVAGNVKVGNRSRWLTRWQALEYITSQNMEKRAFDLLNCITVVPGALGAWRRQAIEAAGGITADTVAEDADLTVAIRRLGWRVCYEERAVAWTEAPETPAVLIRQRFRWTFGTLQSFWKHSSTLFRTKYGTLGWVALPNIFVFQLVLPLISPVIDLMFLGSIILWGLMQLHLSWVPQMTFVTANLERSVLFFLGFLLIDVLTCVVAFALERNEDWTLLIPVLLQRFYYRQLMYVVLFRSVKEAVSGRPVGWRGVEPEPPQRPKGSQRTPEVAHAES